MTVASGIIVLGIKAESIQLGRLRFVEKPRAIEEIVKSSLSRAKFIAECCDFQKLQSLHVRHFMLSGLCPRMNL